ncbi:Vitamin B12 transporter BtuB [subsurface metagenome]
MFLGKRNLILISTALLLVAGLALGEEEAVYMGDLGVIVITPSRLEQPLRDVPVATSVITEEEIERSNAKTVGEILEVVAGAEVKNYGSLGASASISLRGSLANRVLVLIDGKPINSISFGEANLSQISLEDVQRIEIVRGPTSHLYGANALGGVVNIITKEPPQKLVNRVEISYETFNTHVYKFENGSSFGNLGYLITTGKKKSDGLRRNNNYDANDITGKFTYNFKEDITTTMSLRYHDSELGLPGPKPEKGTTTKYGDENVTSLYDRQKDKNFMCDMSLELPVMENSKLFIKGYIDNRKMKYHSVYDDIWTGVKLEEDDKYITNIKGGYIEYKHNFSDKNTVLLGMDGHHDEFDAKQNITNTDTGKVTPKKWNPETDIYGLWLENRWNIFAPITTTLGLRYDHHSTYGSQLSPNFGAIYKINKKNRVRGSIGKAFRAPTFNDLYWPQGGNPDLKPETGWQVEIGGESEISNNFFIRASLFNREIKDMIAWIPDASGLWKPSNVNKHSTWGAELEFNANLTKQITSRISYIFLNAKQIKKEVVYDDFMGTVILEEKERKAAFVPCNKINFDLNYQSNFDLKVSINGQFLDKMVNYYPDYSKLPNVTMNTKKLARHFTLNAKISQGILDNLEIFITGNNLLDTDYKEQFGTSFYDQGYPMPGRTIMAGISWKFGS